MYAAGAIPPSTALKNANERRLPYLRMENKSIVDVDRGVSGSNTRIIEVRIKPRTTGDYSSILKHTLLI